MGESQSKPEMLHHEDRPMNSAYEGKGGGSTASSLHNRKCNKDTNFNFLLGQDGDAASTGDENRNQVRPRTLGPMGRDPPSSLHSGSHHSSGPLSPLSRLPVWSPLEPLPEIESGDDGYGRVPPDGAEEGKMEEEDTRGVMMMMMKEEPLPQGKKGGVYHREGEDDEGLEDEDEWGDSDSEFEFSLRSGGSLSSLNMESGGEGALMGGWDRIGVGETKSDHQSGATDANPQASPETANAIRKSESGRTYLSSRWRGSASRRPPSGSLQEEDEEDEEEEGEEDESSDSDGELPELMDAVWTLRDREKFKAQEMEKHQVQLTMYRRLALIRWVRTLQSRVEEQQNRLQTSFDIILTHRKELLRMGAASSAVATSPTAAPATAVGQS